MFNKGILLYSIAQHKTERRYSNPENIKEYFIYFLHPSEHVKKFTKVCYYIQEYDK